MSPKLRAALALGLVLALGLGAGLLLGSRLAARRFATLNAMANPPHLVAMLHRHLDLDPEQEAVLDSLLDSQATLVGQRIREHRDLMREQMDSLLQALRPHLRDEQWQRLQNQLGKPPRRGRGPGWGPEGPGGPPEGYGPGQRRDGRGPHGRGRGRWHDTAPDSLDPPPPPPEDRP
jgi:hypothetical protein